MSNVVNKKFYCIFLLLFLFSSGFFGIARTNAYFAGEQNSSGNTFSAGTLALSLNNSGNFLSGILYPGDNANTDTTLSNTGTLDSQYIVSSTLAGNDTTACDHVTMSATNGTLSYSGLIKDFISVATTTTNTTWNFSFTIHSDAPPSVWGKTCFFRWIFTAWQNDLPNFSNGFIDVKEKLGSIQIGKAVVLNEFITNPTGLDDRLMPGGEWVELYNNSNNSIDINGLVLYDSDDSHKLFITNSNTDTQGTIIAPHGFLVVYRNGDPNFNLNDDTDTVRLATGFPFASSALLDSFTYTTEKPEGFSFARIPDGVGDWVDPIPTPGEPNNLDSVLSPIDSIENSYSIGSENVASSSLEEPETSGTIPPDFLSENDIEMCSTTDTMATTPNEVISEVVCSTKPEIEEAETLPIPEPILEEPVIQSVSKLPDEIPEMISEVELLTN